MPAQSKKQQRLMGMVHVCQRGGKCGSDMVSKIAKSIKAGDAKDFAETKHNGLPEKVVTESITFREFLLDND